MAAKEDLLNSIDTLVQEKTFNLDALDAIKDLKTKAELLGSELDLMKKSRDASLAREEHCVKTIEGLRAELNILRAREITLEAREKQASVLETQAAVAQAESRVWEKATRIVFAPNTVRENISRSLYRSGSEMTSQGYAQQTKTDTETDTRSDTRTDGYSDVARPENT